MSDVERLLADATPLPWRILGKSIGYDGVHWSLWAEWKIGETNSEADADLIVEAVNRLPDYLAAVEALERLLAEVTDGSGARTGVMLDAEDALYRLRAEVSA